MIGVETRVRVEARRRAVKGDATQGALTARVLLQLTDERARQAVRQVGIAAGVAAVAAGLYYAFK